MKPSKKKAATKRKKAASATPAMGEYKPPSRKERMKSSADMAAHDAVMSHPAVNRMKSTMSKQILKAMTAGPKAMRVTSK